ncbi:MAG: GSCFA domain-containing protein [Flaviramulus sp.]|nr:GSCFA domain-containing protein [Flaviramulus sp.]
MKLLTEIPLISQPHYQIDYDSNILLFGSCFSENIGKKLVYFKFQNYQNPFGILFHPKAIETLITYSINQKEYSEADIFYNNEQWHCFDTHSKLSNNSKEDLLIDLNSQLKSTNKQIHDATHIIITLGTAWVYRFIEINSIVANCHKVSQKQFKKELLSVDDVTQSLNTIISLIKRVNEKASIVFTVSPVKHLKDGFVENTLSKSHLITAIHHVLSHQTQSRCFYFPSYEIMMDELRDYRFYAEDMVHPNQSAIHYIWERFVKVWISQQSLKTMNVIDFIQKGILHKPFNPKSEAHLNFLQQLETKKNQIQKEFPEIIF